jgi:pimeloyl-ACP methyl ester carboxylesterase
VTGSVRELEVDLDGPVHYADHGGHGRPIVLVHGLGGSRLNWLAVAPGLAQDHRVFALDLIGHGLTPRAGRKATLANHRRLIDGFIEKIAGEPAVLVGNSTGGHLSILEAALRPENVAGLILVDPAVPIPVRGSRPSPASLVLAPLLVRGLGEALLMADARRTTSEQVVYRTLKSVSPDYSRIPAEVIQAHLEGQRARHGNRDAHVALLQTGRSLLISNLRRASFYARVREVRAPTLIVQGEKDRLVPLGAVRKLLEIRPDWELHVFPGLGHVPMLEDPTGFLEVVHRWLAGRGQAAA